MRSEHVIYARISCRGSFKATTRRSVAVGDAPTGRSVVPAADVAAEAAALAGRLATGPTLAYAAAKRALATAWALPLADVLAAEQEDQQRLGLTGDHRDAVTAFLGKQRPVFRGR